LLAAVNVLLNACAILVGREVIYMYVCEQIEEEETELQAMHGVTVYSGTSLKGLSELRTQYKKPPY